MAAMAWVVENQMQGDLDTPVGSYQVAPDALAFYRAVFRTACFLRVSLAKLTS
jgi:hypothetical protein